MNWHFIFNRFLVLSVLLFLGCNSPQQATNLPSTDWHALENPAFLNLPLTQAELNEQSAAWVKSLEDKLRGFWNPKIRKGSVEEWLVSQKMEVERELSGTEDGSIYSLEFNMRVSERILHELRKHKEK